MYENWDELEKECKNCKKCNLCSTRKNIVIGTGNKKAEIMFIGEGPGADEDEQGIPFVGKAGQLMNKALQGIGLNREDIYITNIVKCRPPQNRNPEKDEADICKEYIDSQIKLINPKVIVLLRKCSTKKYIRGRIWNNIKQRKMV